MLLKSLLKILSFCALGVIAGLLLTGCGAKEVGEEKPALAFSQEAYDNTTFDPTTSTEATEAAEAAADIMEAKLMTYECQHIALDIDSFQETHPKSDKTVVPYSLSVGIKDYNDVTWAYDWYEENDLSLPLIDGQWGQFYDELYEYYWSREGLVIKDKESGISLYDISFETDDWYVMGPCAKLEDGILYAVQIYNGYAKPNTCFMYAYDLINGELIWRSADQTFNSMNFLMKGDVILCGYGFTMENDYLYQIDKYTGEVISEITLSKMPNLLVEKDGKLYMHTYSYDYVFDFE